jgi:uncharacterized protein
VPTSNDQAKPPGNLASTARTTLRRKKERGRHEREVAYAILDEGLLCHVGFTVDGSTFVMPMAYTRIEDALYLHGAAGNDMLRRLAEGAEACVTVTLLDALVLARSAFHHSMNYRSVMLFGTATRVVDDDEKRRASIALLEHMVPGRGSDARPPSPEELRAVLMVRVPIAEGSAKVRTGGPVDEPEDLSEPVWAGQIPLSTVAGAAVPDDALSAAVEEPPYVRTYPVRGTDAGAVVPSAGLGPHDVEPGG